jgi:hypothetical protein
MLGRRNQPHGCYARKFMQVRHAGRYLGTKRLTILISAKQPRTSYNIYAVISLNQYPCEAKIP